MSAATDVSTLFAVNPAFNDDISKWNTASLTNMRGMFAIAAAFNQNIASWNTASVTGTVGTFAFQYMFSYAYAVSKCNQGAMYTAWGAKFQDAEPTFGYACPR